MCKTFLHFQGALLLGRSYLMSFITSQDNLKSTGVKVIFFSL